ncbi:MAG: DNA polymerase domain-containing protein [Candidatus Thalassarchaeaceae archaeon]|nr:DNA polymerase domain-containing protein [Candidatus Thalassarchaeaceae archaeon]MDP7003546.1 DNA polymerase domain-containing protein [Candidatus Thalassarchaeaceae archaeon]
MRWEEDTCIVSGDNRAWPDEPRTVIELWCRSRAGHSTLLLVNGLRPYVEISDPKSDGSPEDPELLGNVSSVRDVQADPEPSGMKLSQDGVVRPHYRVFVKDTTKVRSVRKALSDSGWRVTSADILFVQRLLLDLDLGPHIRAGGEVLWTGDRAPEGAKTPESTDPEVAEARIKEAGGSGVYPVDMILSCDLSGLERADPFPAPFVTMSFDLETSIADNTILCAAAVVDRAGERVEYPITGAETEILERLTEIVRSEDPDFITGYNIDNFDLPRMEERSEYIDTESEMSRASLLGWARVPMNDAETKRGWRRPGRIFPNREQNRVWTIRGRIPLDAWWQARQTLRPQRESLRYVSRLLWPDDEEMQKMDIDASKMDEEWAERPDEVLDYCVRDTVLPLNILDKLKSTARKEALASVSLTTVDIAATSTTSRWIDSLVIRLADRRGVAVPNTNQGPRKRDRIAGGYVHEVEPGVAPWVVVLDFKSMYPSIMISNNICSTTLVRDDSEDGSHSVSPTTNTRYISKEERFGLVPQLLEGLMDSRDRHKTALAKANEEGDEAEAFLQDQLQYAVKILMNSFYGVFASNFYRFTHPSLGASITEWARHNIRGIISGLETDGYDVVYSDTDSIFVRAPVEGEPPMNRPEGGEEMDSWEQARKTTLNFGESLAERFSKEGAELEFETALSSFFSHGAKKRYVGRVIWPREEMLIRGYEVRRTDSFQLLSDTMTQMFEMILDGDTLGAVDMTKSMIDRVREGDVDPAQLVISRSVKGKWDSKKNEGDFSVYANPDGLPYVRAARQRIAAGLQFTPGMKVGYVVTEPEEGEKKLGVSAWLVDEIGDDPPDYDREYYAGRLAKSLGRITEAFGWTEQELLRGTRQSSIFDF